MTAGPILNLSTNPIRFAAEIVESEHGERSALGAHRYDDSRVDAALLEHLAHRHGLGRQGV